MSDIPPEPTKDEITLLRSSVLLKLKDDNILSTLDKRDITRFETDDGYVRRFLMHHDNDQKLATEMVIDTFKWRKEVGANDITEESLDKTLLDKEALFPINRDINGCKMLVFFVRKHNKDNVDIEKLKIFLIYWIERLEREENGEWITIFFDMKDAGLKNMDMVFIQYFINLFKFYYPWILNYIIVFEMPWILNALWKIIKGWLPPKAIDKVKFVDKKSLKTYVPEDQCLVSWGGKVDVAFQFEPEKRVQMGTAADLEAKKVHFAEQVGNASNVDTSGATTTTVSENTKFQVEPAEELTFNSNQIGATTSLIFTNHSPTRLAFKIKTTSPDKYRVRPSVGTLASKGRIDVAVTLSDKLAPSLLVRDKFLVIVIPTTQETITQQEFADSLKNTKKSDITEVKLRVGMVHSEVTESVGNHVASPPPVSPVLMAKLDQLMTRQTVIEEQVGSLRRLMYVVFFLMIAFLFVFVIMTNNLTSSILIHSQKPSHEHEL